MRFLSDNRLCWIALLPVFLVMGIFVFPGFVNAATQNEGIDRGLYDKTVDPSISNDELRSADKFFDDVEDFVLIGDFQAYGNYSDLDSDDQTGGSCYGLLAPVYKLGERMLFIGMYDGQYDKRLELYSDESGRRKRSAFQRHAFTPMLSIYFGEDSRYSLTPAVFYTATWNKDEGQGASWGSGLYNYRDEGVGLDFQMRRVFGEYGNLKIGMQYYDRRYPNYTNILWEYDQSLGNPTRTYEDEKDYRGIIAMLGYSWITDSGFSWAIDYSLLYKEFDDKKILDSNGIMSQSEVQEDYVHELVLGSWYLFDDIAGGLKLGLDFVFRIYDSNENNLYYENAGNWDVNDDYFSYRSYRLVPNVTYKFEQMPLTVTASYSYEKVDYSDRWALDSGGLWAGRDEQWDSLNQVIFGLRFEVSEKMNVLAQCEYLKGRSNNDDESVYVADYRLNNFLVGFKYSF